ncbi:GatB/YqeY domain-containing protein, partial [Gammaproteobacteria bacterium]|nr:GatB/YqeY domain-containing protein [Gammaproteobacteria bacterium]
KGIDELSASTMQDMGKLMGFLKPQLEGKADMAIVSATVKSLLS